MADLSPGSEVLTPLNRLPVTRSWNWSTWANGDFPHHWPDIRDMGYVLDAPLTGAGGISASGNGRDAIQDGGRKRKCPLPLLGEHQTRSLYYLYALVYWVSIGSDNGLSPHRCQVIIWTNAGLLSMGDELMAGTSWYLLRHVRAGIVDIYFNFWIWLLNHTQEWVLVGAIVLFKFLCVPWRS